MIELKDGPKGSKVILQENRKLAMEKFIAHSYIFVANKIISSLNLSVYNLINKRISKN